MIEMASKRSLGRMVGAHSLRHSFATAMLGKTRMVVTIIGPAGCFAGVQAGVLPRE
jgi:site-specific recombinase XerC